MGRMRQQYRGKATTARLCGRRPRSVSLKGSTGLLGLDGRESLELVLRHRDLGTTLETIGSTGEEAGSVRVKGLVSRRGTLESLAVLVDDRRGLSAGLSLLQVGNDRVLEHVLDNVEREVPDQVPDPDDTDPATGDGVDLGEAPVTETGNDGGDELGETERTHEGIRRSLSPGRTVRTGDKDKSLRDDGDLEVDDHVSSWVVGVLAEWLDVEVALEEVGVVHGAEQGNGRAGEVETVTNTVREDFGEIPGVRGGGRKHSVEGESHDSTVVENRNDKNHE